MGGAANPAMGGVAAPTAQPGQNVYQQSAGAYTGALQGTQAAMGYNPQQVGTQFGYDPGTVGARRVGVNYGYAPQQVGTQFGYNPGSVGTKFGYTPTQVSAQTAAGGIGTYMNPYTDQVINASMADLERQRQTQMGALGAQASAAGAFGGSRQGVAEALTNEGFAQQGGQLAGQLRQQGFQTALGASQQDIANSLQAQMANQQAGGRAAEFGQSTGLQAQLANQAARAQAQQFGQSTGLQAALANQQAGGRAAEFGQSTRLQAQGMNQQAGLQAALANQAARAQAQQFGQSTGLQAALANQQAGLQGAQQLMAGAGQLGNLSSLGFGYGQQIGSTQAAEGQRMQAMNQALIDAAKGQFGGFTGAPQDALSTYLAALGKSQTGQQTQTQTNKPGLLQYLSLGLGLL